MNELMGPVETDEKIKQDDRNHERHVSLTVSLSFALPATVVIGLLVLLIWLQNSAETALAEIAGLLPVGYAFAAGMVASVNPCGFFLLPSYFLLPGD
jgi:hypothetical protein